MQVKKIDKKIQRVGVVWTLNYEFKGGGIGPGERV